MQAQQARSLRFNSKSACLKTFSRQQSRQKTLQTNPRLVQSNQQRKVSVNTYQFDLSDPELLVNIAAGLIGLFGGFFGPKLVTDVLKQDEDRLEEIRELNRATFRETGKYLTEEEIYDMRTPKWTDTREFVDDD